YVPAPIVWTLTEKQPSAPATTGNQVTTPGSSLTMSTWLPAVYPHPESWKVDQAVAGLGEADSEGSDLAVPLVARAAGASAKSAAASAPQAAILLSMMGPFLRTRSAMPSPSASASCC